MQKDAVIGQQRPVKTLSFRSEGWWDRLAFHHQTAEWLLYLMFVSGVVLWQPLSLPWQAQNLLLLLHMVLGATVFTVVMGGFWLSHRRLLTQSDKPFLRHTGRISEWLLLLCCGSGFVLFFYGVPGDALGNLMQDIHFYSSWLLVPLVLRHALRWTVLRLLRPSSTQ
ncbi:hypothetical protein [uncultured Ferrimonas sp.]|uniref:hypothetical protein n=1 Tax=uncultured Ferrimonas sp. TaxID=432640 RepID=UPI00260E34E8|nr:hypothetical protein [uncultured Ferrimonas sp.]